MDTFPEIEDVRRVALNPGDVVVIRCRGRLSAAETQRVVDVAKGHFPGNEVLVMDQQFALDVVGPEAVAS